MWCCSCGQACIERCLLLQVFLDLGDRYLVRPEVIKQGKLLGRGGFGFVFQGSCRNRLNGGPMDVALKMLQPVDPGPNARQSAIVAFKVLVSGVIEVPPLQIITTCL